MPKLTASSLNPTPQRWGRLDALRGVAMLWMTAFHFCFDLNHFGYLRQDFYNDPLWTWQRNCIVGLFLFCAGLSQAVALHQGQSWPRFWRRWGQIAVCALLVTAGSMVMFPKSYIYFGVLHGIAVMLIIVRLTAHWGRWLWLAGGVVFATALAIKVIATEHLFTPAIAHFLNEKAFNWLGLVSVKPITEDFVPVVPWLGCIWWGMAAGQWLLARHPGVFSGQLSAGGGALAALGRWSLSYYMLHQPVLIGLLTLVAALR